MSDLSHLLESQVSKHETVEGGSTTVATVNDEAMDGVPEGAWVFGQKKKGDNIEEVGTLIGPDGVAEVKVIVDGAQVEALMQYNALVPLVVRQRHNYYNHNNKDVNCQSGLIRSNFDETYGKKHGFQCGSECPYKDKARGNDRCKMEWILFAIAIDAEGNEEPVMIYAGGDSWMNFNDWQKGATKRTLELPQEDGTVKKVRKTLRMCASYLNVGSVKRKNGRNVYFRKLFEVGDLVTDAEAYQRYCDMADDVIDNLMNPEEEAPKPAAITGAKGQMALNAGQDAPPSADFDDDDDDIPNDAIDVPFEPDPVDDAKSERMKALQAELRELKSK